MTEFEEWFNNFDPDAYKTGQLDAPVEKTSFEYCARNLRAAYEAGQKHPEWIRATERLPTKNDGDGTLKRAETSKEMNKGTNSAELENEMDYVALQTLADEVIKHLWIPIEERMPEVSDYYLVKTFTRDHIYIIEKLFYDDYFTYIPDRIYIAWQPLP